MRWIKFRKSAIIKDEVLSVPFNTFDKEFELSAFLVEYSGKVYECLCLHLGKLGKDKQEGVPVRIQSTCVTSEVFGSKKCDCAWQLRYSLDLIAKFRKGILIYLPWQEGRGNGLFQKIKSFKLMESGMTTAEAFNALRIPQDSRDYTAPLAVLSRFGIVRIQLITNNPNKINAVTAAGFEIVKRIPIVMQTNDPQLLAYLNSKKLQFGHLI